MDLIKLTNKIINTIPNHVYAIYLTGSQLTNSASDTSDYDVYTVIEPNLYNQIHNINEVNTINTSIENKNLQIKLLTIPMYFQMMFKSNFRTLELFEAKPIYASSEFKRFSDYLYENRQLRYNVNLQFTKDSLIGQSKGHITDIKRKSVVTKNELKRYAKKNIYLIHGLDYLKSINKDEKINIDWQKTNLPFTENAQQIINNIEHCNSNTALKYMSQIITDAEQIDVQINNFTPIFKQLTHNETNNVQEQILTKFISLNISRQYS